MSSTASTDSADGAPLDGESAPVRRWAIILPVAALVLALDQASKWWAVRRLCGPPYCPDRVPAEPIELFWTLRLNYAENTGMAFSAGANRGWLIGIVATGIVVALLVVSRRVTSRLQLVLIGVVVGGALGNVVDRLFRADQGFMSGGVVDFIDLQWWPIFNVADAAVVVGGILLAVSMVLEPEARAGSD